jgi:hypothetical protein
MKSLLWGFAYALVTASLIWLSAASPANAAKGQDFKETTCTCKGCDKGKDRTGQCGTVCKDKTVYGKGSEPHDYCKVAAKARPPKDTVKPATPGGAVAR